MTKHIKLQAEARAKAGKGAARAVRREHRVPAVIYGDNKEPVLISLSAKDLMKYATHHSFFTSICDISLGGKEYKAVPRDVQAHPINDRPIHVDFLRVTDKTMIDVQVPVHLINEDQAPGLDKGGIINWARHELAINCSANNIPTEIVVDIAGMEIGDSVHINDLKLPAGAKAVEGSELTVLSIAAPLVAVADDSASPEFAEASVESADAEDKAEG